MSHGVRTFSNNSRGSQPSTAAIFLIVSGFGSRGLLSNSETFDTRWKPRASKIASWVIRFSLRIRLKFSPTVATPTT